MSEETSEVGNPLDTQKAGKVAKSHDTGCVNAVGAVKLSALPSPASTGKPGSLRKDSEYESLR